MPTHDDLTHAVPAATHPVAPNPTDPASANAADAADADRGLQPHVEIDPTRRAAGPTFDLVALPEAIDVRLTVPDEVRTHLRDIEAARQRQLEALPSTSLDAVAAAYRASVERILDEVHVALRRLAAGLYAVCASCGGEISVHRLELRAWATTCAKCAPRYRY